MNEPKTKVKISENANAPVVPDVPSSLIQASSTEVMQSDSNFFGTQSSVGPTERLSSGRKLGGLLRQKSILKQPTLKLDLKDIDEPPLFHL